MPLVARSEEHKDRSEEDLQNDAAIARALASSGETKQVAVIEETADTMEDDNEDENAADRQGIASTMLACVQIP